MLAADGDHRSSVGRRYGSSDRPDDLLTWDVEASAAEVCQSAGKMLRADYVEAGQMPVVLANRFGGVIFHEACGHLLETTQIERGTTPFSDKVGHSIAHSAVTAIDEGISSGAFGSLSMDDEGMEPQRTVLIKEGVLQCFISDRAGELRTGHQRTGSGRRQSHSFAAASRMRNTYIDAGITTVRTLQRPVTWKKQIQDVVINNIGIGKDRVELEPGIRPTAYLIKSVSAGSSEMFVDSAVPLFNQVDDIVEVKQSVLILDRTTKTGVAATAIVSGTGGLSLIHI